MLRLIAGQAPIAAYGGRANRARHRQAGPKRTKSSLHAYGGCLSRLFQAVLTEKGEEAVTAIRLASIERLEKPLSSLSPAERDELADLSTKAVSLLLKIRLG